MLILEQLAKNVVANWETGDLAAAVRALDAQLTRIAEERAAHEDTIRAARNNYVAHNNADVEIDDLPLLSVAEEGVWVGAWVWVPSESGN